MKIILRFISIFSSTRIAVILINIIFIASIFGTFYNANNFFKSWWYLSLLLLLILSLIVCSSKRFTYLFKESSRTSPNLKFKTLVKVPVPRNAKTMDSVRKTLTIKNYHIIEEKKNQLIGEKNHFSRWGVFIIHIGIIIVAAGVISRTIPGWYMHNYVWIKEGETVDVPGSNYVLKNDHFKVETYNNGTPKQYQTDVQLIDKKTNEVIFHSSTQVNKPIVVDNISIFQSDYHRIFTEVNLQVKENTLQSDLGDVTLNLFYPEKEVALQKPYILLIKEYFPNISLGENNQPISKSLFPKNPAIVFQIKDIQKNTISEKQWFVLRNFKDPSLGQDSNFKFELNYFKDGYVSGLIFHKDLGRPIVFAGLFITVIGLVIALYFQHTKLWITINQNEIIIDGRTNRNIQGLKLEILDISKAVLKKEEIDNDELASNFL